MTQFLVELFSHSVAVGIEEGALQRAWSVQFRHCPLWQEQVTACAMMEAPTEAGHCQVVWNYI